MKRAWRSRAQRDHLRQDGLLVLRLLKQSCDDEQNVPVSVQNMYCTIPFSSKRSPRSPVCDTTLLEVILPEQVGCSNALFCKQFITKSHQFWNLYKLIQYFHVLPLEPSLLASIGLQLYRLITVESQVIMAAMAFLAAALMAQLAAADCHDSTGATCASGASGASGQSLIQSKVKPAQLSTRKCADLVEDDCSFDTEAGASFLCKIEHGSRLMYTTWIRPGASVLEVGARYGQTTCLISKLLHPSQGAKLFSSDADPDIWDVLEGNLAKHNCSAEVVRGVVGSKGFKIVRRDGASPVLGYGKHTVDLNDPRPGTPVPAFSVQSFNATFDTLAIDCEGCFGTFLEENPTLLKTLSMIIVEVHQENGPEQQQVDRLLQEGWELKQSLRRQRVLCKGPCTSQCDQQWVDEHAHQYFGDRLW